MKKCKDCFHYNLYGWCYHQERKRPPGYGCSKWRSKKSWFTEFAEDLTNLWYNHILKLFRR